MRRQVVTQTGIGNTVWLPVNSQQGPFNLGFGCIISGTVTYSVQHTFDDVFTPGATLNAFNNILVTGATTSEDGNYAYPVAAIRLSVTAGTGSVTLTILQGS